MRAAVPDVASHAPSARCLSARLIGFAALAAVTVTVAWRMGTAHSVAMAFQLSSSWSSNEVIAPVTVYVRT